MAVDLNSLQYYKIYLLGKMFTKIYCGLISRSDKMIMSAF